MATQLQAQIDEAIRKLTALRNSTFVSRRINENDADHMDDLRDVTLRLGEINDPLFQACAYHAGLTSMSGASEYARIVTDALEGNLEWQIGQRAEELREPDADILREMRDERRELAAVVL